MLSDNGYIPLKLNDTSSHIYKHVLHAQFMMDRKLQIEVD